MWFVVKTHNGQENTIKDILLKSVPIVSEIYLPTYQTSYINSQGQLQYNSLPLIRGYLFVDLRIWLNPQKATGTDEDLYQRIWKQVRKNISYRGYFFYKTDTSQKIIPVNGTHLLSSNPNKTSPAEFIRKSLIPDEDMNLFISYNGSPEFVNKEFQIIGESFDKLAKVNDTVRIITGPMAGATGVVVERKQKSKDHNYKDRHLEVRLGNSLCVSYSNVRKFDMVIIREAQCGEKGRDSQLWRETDYFIGLLQANGHADDAAIVLCELLIKIHTNKIESLEQISKEMELPCGYKMDTNRLIKLANDIPFYDANTKEILNQYVTPYPIRPFLTPYEDAGQCETTQSVQHKEFRELIIPVKLKTLFEPSASGPEYRHLEANDNYYTYNAHVAIYTNGKDSEHAIVSWGKFYDDYASMSESVKQAFHNDLERRGYIQLHSLLTTGHPYNNPKTSFISFRKIGNIGGFSLVIKGKQEDAAKELVEAVAPAAVEFWQKERLRNWRKLIQRFVLISNPPTEDFV